MSEKADTNNPEHCSCCTCGYTWVKGQHGGHSCAQVMEVTVADLRARLAKYEDAEGRPLQSGVVDDRAAFEVEIPSIAATFDGLYLTPVMPLKAGDHLMTIAQHLLIEKQIRAALTASAPNHSEQVREWVPVSERLPDEIKAEYLCLFDGGHQQVTEWLHDETEGWCFWYGDPTHWMPLPAAPSAGSQKEQGE